MSTALTIALILHIVLGIVGVGAVHTAFMQVMRKNPPYKVVEVFSWIAVFSFIASWATGAYYYVVYYGKAVKPRILESGYPWAHQVFMEAKEHVFILIPFLTIVFALSIYILRSNQDDGALKRAVALLGGVILLLGVFVAASGILVSGAVR